jgi:voltage-dependent potassium channel beta subunit
MNYRRLGKSGLQISELSLGSWLTFGNKISNELAKKLMYHAYDQGINFFDNAEGYAEGKSELVMGEILKQAEWSRETYILSSKVYFGAESKKPNNVGLSKKHIFEACHAALKRLQVDYLDLYYCHRHDPNVPIEEIVWSMHQLIMQGKVLYWGTSEWSAQQITEAHLVAQKHNLIAPVVEQPQYNMFHRFRVEAEYKDIYTNLGLGTTIWSPLASGLLTGKYQHGIPEDARLTSTQLEWLKDLALTEEKLTKVNQLHQLANELGLPLAQLSILWCLKNERVSTVILGASKEEQLLQNLQALNHMALMTNDVMTKIELILDNTPKVVIY